jgi:hypothetical protein
MEVSWKDVLYNKFRFGLHPAMLSNNGYRKKTVCPLIATGKMAQPCTVVFDREYAKAYIKKNIIDKLQPLDIESIHELIEDAQNSEI